MKSPQLLAVGGEAIGGVVCWLLDREWVREHHRGTGKRMPFTALIAAHSELTNVELHRIVMRAAQF